MLHLASVFQHDQGATHVGGFLCSSNECANDIVSQSFAGTMLSDQMCVSVVCQCCGWLFWSF